MVLKTHKVTTCRFYLKSSRGVTFLELLIAISIILVLLSILVFVIRPGALFSQGNDEKRISDITTLDRIVTEYLVETQRYPGEEDTTYYSNTLPSGAVGPVNNISTGWLGTNSNLSKYNSKLPTDPVNEANYRYIYRQDGDSYELNAKLESNTELMQNDGGNNPDMYEVGDNLTLL